MKTFVLPIVIVLFVVTAILSLPSLLPQKETVILSDKALREKALKGGMTPVPKTWEAMLKAVDNPENPVTREKVALGQQLFFDPVLSKDRTVNCATCHNLEEGGDDNLPTAIGIKGQPNPHHFNSPTVLILRNITKTALYFHNGSVDKLEEAVRTMRKYQLGNEFTMEQIDDVVAFLKTLEGKPVSY